MAGRCLLLLLLAACSGGTIDFMPERIHQRANGSCWRTPAHACPPDRGCRPPKPTPVVCPSALAPASASVEAAPAP